MAAEDGADFDDARGVDAVAARLLAEVCDAHGFFFSPGAWRIASRVLRCVDMELGSYSNVKGGGVFFF